jgi:hypothetical protein
MGLQLFNNLARYGIGGGILSSLIGRGGGGGGGGGGILGTAVKAGGAMAAMDYAGMGGLLRTFIANPVTAGLVAAVAPSIDAIIGAQGAANERRRNLGMGIGVAEARGYEAGFGGSILGDPKSTLQAFATAQYNMASPERATMMQLFGVKGAQTELHKNRAEATFDALDKMTEVLSKQPEELRGTYAEALGYTNIASFGDINAYMQKSPGDRKGMRDQAMKDMEASTEHAKEVDSSTDKLSLLNQQVSGLTTTLTNLNTIVQGQAAAGAGKAVQGSMWATEKATTAEIAVVNATVGTLNVGTEKPLIQPKSGDEPFKLPSFPDRLLPGVTPPGKGIPKEYQDLFPELKSEGTPATPQAAGTPGPTSVAMGFAGDKGTAEWLKTWFQQESQLNKSLGQAAENRDTRITDLIQSVEKREDKSDKVNDSITELINILKEKADKDEKIDDKNKGQGPTKEAAAAASSAITKAANAGGGWKSFIKSVFGLGGGLSGSGDSGGFAGTPSGAPPEKGGFTGGPPSSAGGPLIGESTSSQGGGVSGGPVSKNLGKNQAEAYKAFKDLGYSDQAARVMTANLSGESLSDPSNVHADPSRSNPNQKAHGIASWDDARSAAIKAQFGKSPNEMTVAEQVKALDWEQKTKYKDVYATMHDPNASASQQMHAQVAGFEKPANPERDEQKRMGFFGRLPKTFEGAGAASAIKGGGGSSGGGGASGGWTADSSADVVGHLKQMRDQGLITNEQCVSLATASVGIKLGGKGEGAFTGDWRRGEGAEAGSLKPGTPVATFLNRQGQTGETYAIGGHGGQPGAGLDHAAVFEKYLRDKGGKAIGMEVAEQYKGSGGIHERNYMFGQGYGEHTGSNYYAIKTASGGYLGGAANPMTADAVASAAGKRRDDNQDAADRTASRRRRQQLDDDSGPLAMNNWQAPDRKQMRMSLNNNIGADVAIGLATSAQG